MNKIRRESITKLLDQIGAIKEGLEALRDEEQEYLDNMPESLQGGDRYSVSEEIISNMDDAIDALDEAGTLTVD